MPLVQYVGNYDPANATGRILLAPDELGRVRTIDLHGLPVELSDEEYAHLQGSYRLSILDHAPEETDGKPLWEAEELHAEEAAKETHGSDESETPEEDVYSSSSDTPAEGS
jgi:hypothetical protein